MVAKLIFDRSAISKSLAGMKEAHRIAFAACCAERIFGGYELYAKDVSNIEALREALDLVWGSVGHSPDRETLEGRLASLQLLYPDPDDSSPERAYAEDAVAAVEYALMLIQNGDEQNAAYAAQVAYDTLDQFVIRRDDIDISDPSNESRILAGDIIQLELARQRSDLSLLGEAVVLTDELVSRLKARARADSYRFA